MHQRKSEVLVVVSPLLAVGQLIKQDIDIHATVLATFPYLLARACAVITAEPFFIQREGSFVVMHSPEK